MRFCEKNPPEPPYKELVGNLAGLYSRRINIQHRLVYEIFDEEVTIGDVKYEETVKIIRMWTPALGHLEKEWNYLKGIKKIHIFFLKKIKAGINLLKMYVLEISSLSKIQRKAVICFNYDAEMNNGRFSLYRDCYPAINSTELKEALIEISNEDIANNYIKAFKEWEKDDFMETDMKYGTFSPSLCEYLQEYVEKNKDCIFD